MGASCSEGSGCDLHLLQLRANATAEAEASEVAAEESEWGAQAVDQCTAQDQAAMDRMGSNFPKAVAACGKTAYKWFRFHEDQMARCVAQRTGVTGPCSKCLGAAGLYGFNNCKVPCLFG